MTDEKRDGIAEGIKIGIRVSDVLKILTPCIVFLFGIFELCGSITTNFKEGHETHENVVEMKQRLPLIESAISTLTTSINQHEDSMIDYKEYRNYYRQHNKFYYKY